MANKKSQIRSGPALPNDSSELLEPLSGPASLAGLSHLADRRAARRGKTRFSKYKTDYAAYFREVLLVKPWSAQEQILAAVRDHPRVAVAAALGIGKTWLAGGLVNAYFDIYPEGRVVAMAVKFQQVAEQLFAEARAMRKTKPEADMYKIADPDNPRHLVSIRTAQSTEAFRGVHASDMLLIMDEAQGIDRRFWIAGEGLSVATGNRILAIGNPVQPSGPFYEICSGRKPGWVVLNFSVLDHPNVLAGLAGEPDPYPGATSLGWLLDRLKDRDWFDVLGSPFDDAELQAWMTQGAIEFPPDSGEWYQPTQLGTWGVLGKFPESAGDSVWSSRWLEAARDRVLPFPDGLAIEIGIDPARFGADHTAVHARIGPCSVIHATWAKFPLPQTEGRVIGLIEELRSHGRPIHIKIDSSGGDLGAGLFDHLSEHYGTSEDISIEEVPAAGRPLETERYPNKRSELWFAAAFRGRDGDLDLSRLDAEDYDRLNIQLCAPAWEVDSRGRQEVEPKIVTKKKIARSPDDADAFNLAYAGSEAGIVKWGEGMHTSSKWTNRQTEPAAAGWGAGRIERG